MRVLDRLFGKPEEINGANRCPTYLYRWHILKTRWFKVYLHHFVGDDWSLDFHDHPKRFVSIGLKGWYREFTYPKTAGGLLQISTDVPNIRDYHAPWFRSFPATHIHRIATPSGSCWTLVIVFREVRTWGFWHSGKFIPWREYVEGVGGIADRMKACE